MNDRVTRSILSIAILGMAALGLGCGTDALTCSPPAGSVPTDGDFSIDYVGATAMFASETMNVRVVSGDDDVLELWACQQQGDEMWIVETVVTRADNALPATFGFTAGAPRVTAWITRYDNYQVLEEELGDGLSTRLEGTLGAFDVAENPSNVAFDAVVSVPCTLGAVCLATNRTLTVDADLSW